MTSTEQPSSKDSLFVSPQQRKDTLEEIVRIIEKRFAVPAEGDALVKELRTRIDAGRYDDPSLTLGAFSELLTTDLKEISNDKHMSVFFRSETKPERPEEKTLEEERKQQEEDVEEDLEDPFGKTFRAQSALNNNFIKEYRTMPGCVGYVKLHAFPFCTVAAQSYMGLFNLVAGTRALIIDVSTNGGGASSADLLLSYLHKPSRRSTVRLSHRYTGHVTDFTLHPVVSGPRYDDRPVWILCGKDTFSAAEHFCHVAKALGRVRLVGQNTDGGGRGCDMYWVHPNLDMCCSTQEVVCLIDGKSWERTGVAPHVVTKNAEESLEVAHMEALEGILPVLEADPVFKHFGNDGAPGFGRVTLDELRAKYGKGQKTVPAAEEIKESSAAQSGKEPAGSWANWSAGLDKEAATPTAETNDAPAGSWAKWSGPQAGATAELGAEQPSTETPREAGSTPIATEPAGSWSKWSLNVDPNAPTFTPAPASDAPAGSWAHWTSHADKDTTATPDHSTSSSETTPPVVDQTAATRDTLPKHAPSPLIVEPATQEPTPAGSSRASTESLHDDASSSSAHRKKKGLMTKLKGKLGLSHKHKEHHGEMKGHEDGEVRAGRKSMSSAERN
ncbi:hypothetical protein HKX48_005416 [Thoreauomyces humboldtii]|nr:hypothetical protein HKX48_005416 [Thoreauomyces humboldtii]